MITRRQFSLGAAGLAGMSALHLPKMAHAGRTDRLNILCWEGYNSDQVLNPFREAYPAATITAESGTSDPEMINRLRAGEIGTWDLINVNQPWARGEMLRDNLIRPLNKDRFMPYFDKMTPEFAKPYPLAFSDSGDLLGMPQRYGPFSFVVNTDKVSQDMAEDQGWNLFLDPAMKGRYGLLTYDNWNVIHLCLAAGIHPFQAVEGDALQKFTDMAKQIVAGAKLMTDDLVAMNTALINGEIDCYFTGGTYTASPARYDGALNVRAITPRTGPVDGKGGASWVELTSAVNNPDPSDLAEDFLEFVQKPEICEVVAFAEGTYNPVAQMGNPEVMARFDAEKLEAIQFDTLGAEMARSHEFDVVPSYDALLEIYVAARRG